MSSRGQTSLKYLVRKGLEVCHYCSNKADTVDHIVPESLGGPDSVWNLQPSCGPCNRNKGSNWPTCSCEKCQSAVLTFVQNKEWTEKAREVLSRRIDVLESQLVEIDNAKVRVLTSRSRAEENLVHLDNLVLTHRFPFDRVDL